ncbi:DUF3592 domain-containing protein [Dietzia sp. ANT_WB102]|uniref:DUF3592 domain-containing protein n=1 Tax=Dietzia sp. ANT_WB102 TaxID=2597345 RepID=UPI0011EE09C7|nr:DUF3592 domain-containing protein [Dietzia sp. ANT_WB102]KAA0919021.1 hypothetical protein FQ137_06945 [Dietzia sp. ANT_WB102]
MTATTFSTGRARRAVRTRRGVRVVAVIAGVFSLLTAVLIVLACFIDDQRIDRDMGSATATVTEVTDRRAAVEFDTGGGRTVRPVTGVFYPTGLIEGQQVQVEFRRANPDLVRVSGRSWTVAVVPALSVPAVVVPLAVLMYATASRRGHPSPPRVPRMVRR